MITLSRPINWAYYYYGWRNSGLSFLAFYERVFEQAYPPISKAEVIAGFMLQHGADQPKTHSKPDRHSKQIWESSAAPDSNAVRIIMFAEYPAEEPLAENPPKRLSAQALLPLRVKPHRALQSALDLLRSLGESRQSIFRQTGDNGGLSC